MQLRFYSINDFRFGARTSTGLLVTTLTFFLSSSGITELAGNEPKSTIYFHSPEINVGNFASLKESFDHYLSSRGPYVFQPFSDRAAFEKAIKADSNGVYFLAGNHFQNLQSTLNIRPALVGVWDSRITQRYVLCSSIHIDGVEKLSGAKVACAGDFEFAQMTLHRIRNADRYIIPEDFQLLTVPKGLDALLSICFGIVSFAVVPEYSLHHLESLSATQRGMIRLLATGVPSILPLVAVPESITDEIGRLIEVLAEMGNQVEGTKRLNMIGLDRLQPIGADDKKRIESILFGKRIHE